MRYLSLVLFFVIQSCVTSAQTFVGSWKGELKIQGQSLPLIFEFQQMDKAWQGFMQSPAQSAAKLPISQVKVVGDSIYVSVKNIGLSYAGLIDGNTIEGKFKQGTFEANMNLDRYDAESKEKQVVRTQVVSPPYSYDTAAVTVYNKYDNIELAGTLTFPKKKGIFPAVVLLTGSGPQNRDEELFGHKPFRVLADYLTSKEIVVLRLDDRGMGDSKGDFGMSTIENFSKDAISAFDFLSKQPQVDANKVGIIGHSEGALIAELLAGQNLPDLSFIVLLAGPSFSIDKLMVEQLYSVGKAAGMSEFDLAKARVINEKNFAVVKSDLNTEDAYKQLLVNMSFEGDMRNDSQMRTELLTLLAPAYRYFMRIEPEKYISKIKIPVFAAFGTLDVQVPSEPNLKSLYDLLPRNPKTVLKEYKGMNHLFQKAKTGQVSEYTSIEETINPQVLSDIASWINGLYK